MTLTQVAKASDTPKDVSDVMEQTARRLVEAGRAETSKCPAPAFFCTSLVRPKKFKSRCLINVFTQVSRCLAEQPR